MPAQIAALGALLVTASCAAQTVRNYDVRRATAAPAIDGVVSPGEWDAAGQAAGDWGELQQFSPPDADTAGNRFRMVWDDQALYLLYQTNQGQWGSAPAEPNPLFDFVLDQLYLYFDPNVDGEPNFDVNPDETPDGYELAFNQVAGQRVATGAHRNGVGVSTEARVDSLFGDQANWNRGDDPLTGAALRDAIIAQNNSAAGGVAELRLPWTLFDANANYLGPHPRGDYTADGTVDAADYTHWRDTLGLGVVAPGSGADGNENGVVDAGDRQVWADHYGAAGQVATGLHHPFAPAVGDTWFLNIGQVTSADPLNAMPVYNWTESFFFAARPHAEIVFLGPAVASAGSVPEPTSGVVVLVSLGVLLIIRFIRPRAGATDASSTTYAAIFRLRQSHRPPRPSAGYATTHPSRWVRCEASCSSGARR